VQIVKRRRRVIGQKLNLGTLKSLASRVDQTMRERKEFLRTLAEDQG
jgi:hypothetical protein